jgi:hypothetical protein
VFALFHKASRAFEIIHTIIDSELNADWADSIAFADCTKYKLATITASTAPLSNSSVREIETK